MKNQHEVEKLAYAMTRQRYLLNRDIVHDLFTELSLSDYIALHSIAEAAGQGGSAEQTYLRDLAERLELPIPKTSKMIRKLTSGGWYSGPTAATGATAPTSSSLIPASEPWSGRQIF